MNHISHKYSKSYQLIFIIIFGLLLSCQSTSEEKENDNIQKNYRKNGTLMSSIEHKDGKRHGISTGYFEDGKTKQAEITYNMGVKHGITKMYYGDGKLYYSVNYVDGQKDGMMIKYDNKGRKTAEILPEN